MQENITVMVLDDELIVCKRLKNHLQKRGYLVETYTESQKALDRLKEKTFDILITDLKMSGPDGLDVLVFVRSNNLSTQVIMITAYPDIESRVAAEFMDAIDYIIKPFKLSDIEHKVSIAAKKIRKTQPGVIDKIKNIIIKPK